MQSPRERYDTVHVVVVPLRFLLELLLEPLLLPNRRVHRKAFTGNLSLISGRFALAAEGTLRDARARARVNEPVARGDRGTRSHDHRHRRGDRVHSLRPVRGATGARVVRSIGRPRLASPHQSRSSFRQTTTLTLAPAPPIPSTAASRGRHPRRGALEEKRSADQQKWRAAPVVVARMTRKPTTTTTTTRSCPRRSSIADDDATSSSSRCASSSRRSWRSRGSSAR